jgi:hypothetical protein
LALDPKSAKVQTLLALTLANRVLARMTDTPADDIIRAEELIGRALAASPDSALAHFTKGQLLRSRGRSGEAIPEFETAIAANRNWAGAFFFSRGVQVVGGVDRGGDPTRGAGDPS